MKGVEIRFATDNSAFEEDYRAEVARILHGIAKSMEAGAPLRPSWRPVSFGLFDANGNWVGEARFDVEMPRGWPKRPR